LREKVKKFKKTIVFLSEKVSSAQFSGSLVDLFLKIRTLKTLNEKREREKKYVNKQMSNRFVGRREVKKTAMR